MDRAYFEIYGHMLLHLDDRMFFVKNAKFTADTKSKMLPITFIAVEEHDFLDNPETKQRYEITLIVDANLCHDIIEFYVTREEDDAFMITAKHGLLNWRIVPGDEWRKFSEDKTEKS
jgi:hypothetical protein